jgi:hypothetical protein
MNKENYIKGFKIEDPSVLRKSEDPEKEFKMIFEKESFEFEVEKVNRLNEVHNHFMRVYLIPIIFLLIMLLIFNRW